MPNDSAGRSRPEFHIHVDAARLEPSFERTLQDLYGFQVMDFDNTVTDGPCYAPERHLTLKLYDGRAFVRTFDAVERLARDSGGISGYVEGEYVALNATLQGGPFDPSAVLPVAFTTRPLPAGLFRQSEVHLTFRCTPPHPALAAALRAAGFVTAFVPKPDGMAMLFTAQGTRRQLAEILPPTLAFLSRAGGFATAKIKEERIVRWWTSGSDVQLPPVIDLISTFSAAASPA
jgi:hypothetical protein